MVESHKYDFSGLYLFCCCLAWFVTIDLVCVVIDKVTDSRYHVCSSPIRLVSHKKTRAIVHVQGTSSRPMHMIFFWRRSNICSWLVFFSHIWMYSILFSHANRLQKKCHLQAWCFTKKKNQWCGTHQSNAQINQCTKNNHVNI